MTTIESLKIRIAGYHDKEPNDYIDDTEDYILSALDTARLEVEQLHDLNSAYVLADLTVDEVAGVNMNTAVVRGTVDPVRIKTIIDAGRFSDDGVYFPTGYTRLSDVRNKQKRQKELGTHGSLADHAPSDAEWEANQHRGKKLVIAGTQVYLPYRGTASVTKLVGIEGYRWFENYTDASEPDQDPILENGHNYLLYAAICELNLKWRKFAPREEGNIPAPTREKDRALAAFLTWDSYYTH